MNILPMERTELRQSSLLKEKITEAITQIREKIQKEFESTSNNWFTCFISRITKIDLILYRANRESPISNYTIIHQQLDELTLRIRNLQHSDTNEPQLPPPELQEELISELVSIAQAAYREH